MSCRERSCCCGGCSSPPVDGRLPTAALQPMQQYCIACLPIMICVEFDNGVDEPFSRIATRSCGDLDAPPEEDPIIYSVGIAGETLVFRLHVEDGVCTICLDGGDCQPINTEEPPYCDDIMAYEFSYEGSTVRTSTADNIGIVDTVNCTCCNCICRCICFHVNDTTEQVCLTIEEGIASWERSDGYVIRMGGYLPNERCSLTLEDPNGYDTGPPVILTGDSASEKDCPDPVVVWEYVDDDGNEIIVVFDCVYCDKCKGSVNDCCDRPVPRVLTAVADMDCPTGCADYTLILVNLIGSTWEGDDPDAWCTLPMSLSLSCAGGTWVLTGGQFLATATLVSAECDPFRLEFNVEHVAVGVCGGAETGALGTVVITE